MIRGNDKKDIFIDEQDKMYFIEILKTKKEGDIANIMKRINISYVFFFNKKYKKIGHLFQDRYKSEKMEEDSYLKPNNINGAVIKDI